MRELLLSNWAKFVTPLGLDSYLQGVWYELSVGSLTGYAMTVWTGCHKVTAATDSTAIIAIGQMIALSIGVNTTKLHGMENKLLPYLGQMLDSWWKNDPPLNKKTSCWISVLNYLCHVGQSQTATPLRGCSWWPNLICILLSPVSRGIHYKKGPELFKINRVFKIEDMTFLQGQFGASTSAGPNSPHKLIMTTDSAMQNWAIKRMVGKVSASIRRPMGESVACPACALWHCYISICEHTKTQR